jgi:hypothetical protein
MKTTSDTRLFVAVNVFRGVVSDVQAFQDEEPAQRRAKYWQRSANPDHDTIGVWEVAVHPSRKSTSDSVSTRRMSE